jgi:hypothetical protein
MLPTEYLDAAKARLQLKSDYALAKLAKVRREDIPGIRSGKRAVPLDLAYWLAITLEKDPAEVIADLELQREKNPERVKFWNSFLSRAACWLGTAAVLLLTSSAPTGNAQAATGGNWTTSHNLAFRRILEALGLIDSRRSITA